MSGSWRGEWDKKRCFDKAGNTWQKRKVGGGVAYEMERRNRRAARNLEGWRSRGQVKGLDED